MIRQGPEAGAALGAATRAGAGEGEVVDGAEETLGAAAVLLVSRCAERSSLSPPRWSQGATNRPCQRPRPARFAAASSSTYAAEYLR